MKYAFEIAYSSSLDRKTNLSEADECEPCVNLSNALKQVGTDNSIYSDPGFLHQTLAKL